MKRKIFFLVLPTHTETRYSKKIIYDDRNSSRDYNICIYLLFSLVIEALRYLMKRKVYPCFADAYKDQDNPKKERKKLNMMTEIAGEIITYVFIY
jgi:hypothetical protein